MILLHQLSGNKLEYRECDFSISTAGSDIFIHLGKKHFALKWPEELRITISKLRRVIKHRWTYLQEHNTDDFCNDCDGYDYSNCDMSRCKNYCEDCGGRRFICNNGCFYHRHKTCLTIECDNEIVENDLIEAFSIIDSIIVPHSDHSSILNRHGDYLKQWYDESVFVGCFCHRCAVIDKYKEQYEFMQKKEVDRDMSNYYGVKIIIRNDENRVSYDVKLDSVSLDNTGFFPSLRKKALFINGYDYSKDDYQKEKYNIKFANLRNGLLLKRVIKHNNVKEIIITIKNGIVYDISITH